MAAAPSSQRKDLPWKKVRSNGFAPESWLASYSKTMKIHGEEWSLQLENIPLKVLQMGNLFGRCLSVDDSNAFSAIANAVEINKQVLYIRDSRGVVIGRKLIGLSPNGRLLWLQILRRRMS